MTDEDSLNPLPGECKCEAKYTIELHGEGYALYHGRCRHRHGYNLINMVEPAWNFDAEHIAKLINLGVKEYWKNTDEGHIAE